MWLRVTAYYDPRVDDISLSFGPSDPPTVDDIWPFFSEQVTVGHRAGMINTYFSRANVIMTKSAEMTQSGCDRAVTAWIKADKVSFDTMKDMTMACSNEDLTVEVDGVEFNAYRDNPMDFLDTDTNGTDRDHG